MKLRLVLFLGLVTLCAIPNSGCRKRGASADSATGVDPAATSAAGAGAPRFATPPPLPANAPPPVMESVQFYPPEPVNMYAPVRPGAYQAQLDAYNRVLRKWTQENMTPRDLNHLMSIYNGPKPPQPPAGRRLFFDPKTITVSLQ